MVEQLSTDNEFWHFSLKHYPAIKETAQDFQDRHRGNVNLLLFAAFMDSKQRTLGEVEWKHLQQLILLLDEKLLAPLRQVRLNAKSIVPEGLYQQLKAVELGAEQLVQSRLWQWWQSNCERLPKSQASLANINKYWFEQTDGEEMPSEMENYFNQELTQ